jgi:membrane protease YdiL (CAAX protease family)
VFGVGTPSPQSDQRESRIEAVCLGVAVVVGGYGIMEFGDAAAIALFGSVRFVALNLHSQTWFNSLQLAYALMLVLPTWRRSGLRIGEIGSWWPQVLFVCSVPIVVTAVVYPLLPERPFANAAWSFWVIGPPAEDLIFSGFLYGRLRLAFRGVVHMRVPIHTALVVTAALFGLWHVPMMGHSVGYGCFQIAYTFVGGMLVGLARQWTGSVLYGMLSHMAVNAIAVYAG